MATITRPCMICGKEHPVHCEQCNDNLPTWSVLYDDEDCVAIGQVWYAYRGNEVTKDDAKKKIEKYPQKIEGISKHTSIAAKEIRAILDIKEPEEKPEVEEKVEEPETKEASVEKKAEKFEYKKNYKK